MRIALLFAALIAMPFAAVRAWQWWTGAGTSAIGPPTRSLSPEAVIATLADRERRDRPQLRASYPLGYTLVEVAGTRLHHLDGPPAAAAPRVDWGRTEMLSATPTSVILRPPDVVAGDGATVSARPAARGDPPRPGRVQAASPSKRSTFWRTSDGSTTGLER